MGEKTLFYIHNDEKDIDHYIALTENQIAFLNWLFDRGYLDENTFYNQMTHQIKEF